ncbi:D-alanyl-D-alanine dipeptidase [Roseimicrobium gellanilyticum]|uniref:D-alanyl-D-alanine dipeptidase n=2 Tax=Roseimicrobium gellanilyticum TaxID=748857 RepID=A0A366HP62_9BACT|nr:D-alanyl-D-alanine dipeptidase [Roseimicrobium gellanilyticum]
MPRFIPQGLRSFCRTAVPLVLLALVSCAGSSTYTESKTQTLALARSRGLVEVTSVVPGIKYDLLYRKANNITRQRVYPEDMPCLLHHTTAAKLRVAQEILQRQGYGLKVWDAWRPPESHTVLHDHGGYTGMFTPPEYMWSRHCSGTAVDVTLVDAGGRELAMPTGFDEGGPDSYYTASNVSAEKRERRAILQMAMTSAGFSILNTEWWHFDDATYDSRGTLPVPPVVYAKAIGLNLPKVRPPKVKRQYVYPDGSTTTTTSATVPLPPNLGGTSYLPGADSGSGVTPTSEPAAVKKTPPPPVMLPTVPSIAPGVQ